MISSARALGLNTKNTNEAIAYCRNREWSVSDEEIRAYISAHPQEFYRFRKVPNLYETVKDQVRQGISASKAEKWFNDKKAQANIVINEEAIDKLQIF